MDYISASLGSIRVGENESDLPKPGGGGNPLDLAAMREQIVIRHDAQKDQQATLAQGQRDGSANKMRNQERQLRNNNRARFSNARGKGDQERRLRNHTSTRVARVRYIDAVRPRAVPQMLARARQRRQTASHQHRVAKVEDGNEDEVDCLRDARMQEAKENDRMTAAQTKEAAEIVARMRSRIRRRMRHSADDAFLSGAFDGFSIAKHKSDRGKTQRILIDASFLI